MPYEGQDDAYALAEVGRIRMIEQPAGRRPSASARAVLADADVVLYDPALAPLVIGQLPHGRYAEPLSVAVAAVSPRARQLAADGWSVVQLIQPREQSLSAPPEASAADEWLTPIVRPLGSRATAAAIAFTANGLAG